MRNAAAAMSVGEEMKIGLSRNRSAEAPSSGRNASAHQPRSRPSQPIRKSITTSVPRMARSCARYQRKVAGICNSPLAARIGSVELMPPRPPSAASVMIGSTRVWPPFFEPPLDGVEQRDHDQPRGHEHEHAEKDDIGLKRIASVGDHVAEARGRRVELADDDPEQRAAGAVFQAGEDEGTVPGRMMLEKIFTLEAEKLRATRMKRASLVLTPDWVLMRIGMTAPRKTTTTLDQMPMPHQMMMRGKSVTRGTALSVSTNGPIMYCSRLDKPTASPSGIASASAAP